MNRRDIELLSSYLDGQLRPSASARLEARLSSDPGLRAVLDDLRAARGLLRQLPMRKAPRNFTLTPKMVGKNPPLPRAYSAFRFVTALASLLLFFTVGLNFLVPQMASQSPAFGMGGGGAPEILSAEAPAMPEAAATEAPAAEAPATEAPAEEPAIQMVPLPTGTAAAADSARELENAAGKEGITGNSEAQDLARVPEAPRPVPPVWQLALAVIALLGALAMLVMRRLAAERWRRR
jgi:anti-sigma factor RsiW